MSSYAIAVDPQNPENFIKIDREIPTPQDDDVLVQIKAISMNPVDTKIHSGLIKNGLKEPRILGWDASGVVLSVGKNVNVFKEGDEVWYAGDVGRPGSNSTHQLIDHRLLSLKPKTLSWAEAAAMPLTSITAWEGLFERLNIQSAAEGKTLLIIGGAGGVGSMAIPLAAQQSTVRIVATASRPESVQWCLDRGAEMTVDYHNLKENLLKQDIAQVDYIFCLNNTEQHWQAMSEIIAPFGHICSIVESHQPLDQSIIRDKSAALHWEFMFTRSKYQTPDMAEQGHILRKIADMVDNYELQTNLNKTLKGLSVESIQEAHKIQKEGHMNGKIVIEY